MSKTPEGVVKDAVKKKLEANGVIPASKVAKYLAEGRKFDGWYYMPVQSMYAVKGIPDFIVCYKGRFVAIETKAPRCSTTSNQDDQLEAIGLAGGRVFVADNASTIDELFEETA